MTKTFKRMTSVVLAAALACAVAACFVGCKKQEEPSYQAVVVSDTVIDGDLYIVQFADGAMTSGLIALHLPETCDVDPATLGRGDIINVFGSDAIAMSYPGQANCTNITLADHLEGAALDPFLAEWNTFAEQLSAE